jgi:gluconate 2-dehydrogenase alpha chain
MSQIIEEPEADVAVLGLGVAGGIVATELAVNGYKVVGIDKGPMWNYADDFATLKYDEWGIGMMRKFDHPLELYTSTLRNTRYQYANPLRRYTMPVQIISLGHGVGGAAHHYAAAMGRYGPWTYEMYSQTVSRYGLDYLTSIQPDQDMQDWPMTYQEYEPYYVEWEKCWGVVGTNQGPLVPMSVNYPLPPAPSTPAGQLFQNSTEALGYNPYPSPHALASQPYVNQYGVQVNPCVYDGWCGGLCNYACETGAKANSDFRAVPAAISSGNFTLVTNSWVYRLDVDPGTGLVSSVRYYDPMGNIHVQPAKAFMGGLWGHNTARLMLTSGIGDPYDPVTVTGSVGRGISNGVPPVYDAYSLPGASGVLNMGANAYPAGNASGGGFTLYDLTDDNFDHTGLNFIGGNMPAAGGYAGGGPSNLVLAGSSGPGSQGSTYKASLKDMYLQTKTGVSIFMPGPEIPTTAWFIDLDPHHVDAFGDPLPRETLDWSNNMYNCANYMAPKVTNILQKMGCSNVTVSPQSVAPGSYHEDSFQLHRRGGLRLGSDSATSVLNKWQQSWTTPNFFTAGEVCNTTGTYNTAGTHGMGPQCYVAAEGIKRYLNSPGPLV